jgi:hypothetical protein
MRYGKDDYLIVEVKGRPKLGLAFAKGKVMLEDGVETDEPTIVEFKSSEILANLGKAPREGQQAFGVKINIFRETLKFPNWDVPLHVYRELGDRDKRLLRKAMSKAWAKLDKWGATDWLQSLERMEVRPKKGKVEGWYRYQTTKSVAKDCLALAPENFQELERMIFVILHESSHGIWFRTVSQGYQARWAALFNKRGSLNRYKDKDLGRLSQAMVDMVAHGATFKDIKKELKSENPEELEILKEVVSYIKKTHHIDEDALQSLAKTKPEKFQSLWPAVADHTDWRADVSEYSTTNLKEFFAECMGYFLLGRKLPKDVTAACKNTLKNLEQPRYVTGGGD